MGIVAKTASFALWQSHQAVWLYVLEGGGAGLADSRLVSVVLEAWVIWRPSKLCKSESSSDTNTFGSIAVVVSIITSVESLVPSRQNSKLRSFELPHTLISEGLLNLNQTWLLWFTAHLEQSIEHKMQTTYKVHVASHNYYKHFLFYIRNFYFFYFLWRIVQLLDFCSEKMLCMFQ